MAKASALKMRIRRTGLSAIRPGGPALKQGAFRERVGTRCARNQWLCVQSWTMRVTVRLARRQVSRYVALLGQEWRPHEQDSRPFGFSATLHGLPSWDLQNGHISVDLL
jgi:hypothetical protein